MKTKQIINSNSNLKIPGGAGGAKIFCAWFIMIGPGDGALPGSKYLTSTSLEHSIQLDCFW
jgi:hypothetical protein